MKEIKTEIIINASPSRVWNVLTDFSAYSDWSTFIESIEGEPIKGTRLRNTMVLNDRPQVFKPIVTRVESNQVFEWEGRLPLGLFIGQHYFILEANGDHQTKLIHGEKFRGLLHGLILRKIGEDTLRAFQRWNKALKARAESELG